MAPWLPSLFIDSSTSFTESPWGKVIGGEFKRRTAGRSTSGSSCCRICHKTQFVLLFFLSFHPSFLFPPSFLVSFFISVSFFLYVALCVNLKCALQSCTVHTSLQAFVTDAPTHSRWLKSWPQKGFHMVASLSDATGETLETVRGQAQDRGISSSSNSSRIVNKHGRHSIFFTAFQQQLRQEMTDVIKQEVNETVSGRLAC